MKKFCTVNELFFLLLVLKSLYYKQTKTNLQKYFHPSSLNQLIYTHMHCACNAESPTRFQLKCRWQGFSPLCVIALCPDISWEMMSNQVSWPDMRHSLQVPGGQPGQDPHHSGHTHTVRKNSAKIKISRNIYSWGGVQVRYRWNLSDIWVSCHPWVNIRWNFNFRRFFYQCTQIKLWRDSLTSFLFEFFLL